MSDLVTWLREQIAADKLYAEHAGEHDDNWEYRRAPGVTITDREGESSSPDGGISWHPGTGMAIYTHWEEDGEHIVRHDPRNVEATCEAHSRILDDSVDVLSGDGDGPDLAERTLRRLALAYQHRPGFREEWRP